VLPILALWLVYVKVFTILWLLWWNLTISASTIGKRIILLFFWYPTLVYSTSVFGDTATLLCYVFLWSMVVDVKLFTIEKLYHLDHLFCSRPKLVIHCYLLKPLLIDRAHSNDSNSGLIYILFYFRRWERVGASTASLPRSHFSAPPHPRRRRRGDQTTRATHSTTIVVQTSKLCLAAWRS
jgi:hypothetical protein